MSGLILADRTGLRKMPQYLGHEEGVAVSLAIEQMSKADGRVIKGVPGRGLHERHHSIVIEPGQIDPRNCALATESAERVHQGTGTGYLGAPIGSDDKYFRGQFGLGQVAQQHQAPRICPLKVVEHQDDRLDL